MKASKQFDARFQATVDVIRRTGAKSFEIRYSDDSEPTVWMAIAGYPEARWEAAGGMDPLTAVWRLAELLLDGGQCKHCGRPSGISENWKGTMPLGGLICWYIYDPETKKFRRSCE